MGNDSSCRPGNSQTTCKGVILAAGNGLRLRPFTDTVPKCMLPIMGRPLLDYWLHALADAGIREILLNTHAHREQVVSFIEAVNRRGGLDLEEAHEPELLGSAGTLIGNAERLLGAETLLVIYADNLSNANLSEMIKFHRSHDLPITMLLFCAPNPSECGIVELDRSATVIGFAEKPAKPRSNLANGGIYLIERSAYMEILKLRAFDMAIDVLPKFLGRIRGWKWDGYHVDIGTPEAYERAKSLAGEALATRGYHSDGKRSAVFLDRDGTLIEDKRYLADPADIRLLAGSAESIVRLREAGYACLAVTNQSAVGRGIITERRLEAIHREFCRRLARVGAVLDGIYYCTVAPETTDRTVVEHPDRKPAPGMLYRAAKELGLDLASSWMVGDMVSDVLAGRAANCRESILIDPQHVAVGGPPNSENEWTTVGSITEAADLILRQSRFSFEGSK